MWALHVLMLQGSAHFHAGNFLVVGSHRSSGFTLSIECVHDSDTISAEQHPG